MLLIGVQHHQLEVVPVKTREYFLLIQLADNFQSWPEYGDIGTLVPHWWLCKLVCSLDGRLVVSIKTLREHALRPNNFTRRTKPYKDTQRCV